MELRREMSWLEMHTAERFLRTLTEERWGLTEEAEGGVAVMAEEEAERQEGHGESDFVHGESGDEASVAVGAADSLNLYEQMVELEKFLRESGRNCDAHLHKHEAYGRAQKALYRCVDQIRSFNNGH